MSYAAAFRRNNHEFFFTGDNVREHEGIHRHIRVQTPEVPQSGQFSIFEVLSFAIFHIMLVIFDGNHVPAFIAHVPGTCFFSVIVAAQGVYSGLSAHTSGTQIP